jgi:hypothetical protein
VALTPALLVANALTGAKSLQVAIYVVGLAAFVACAGPFLASLRRNSAGILLVLLFGVLTASMAAALLAEPSAGLWLAAKGLAATAVWASIYFVVFLAIRTPACLIRLVKWIHPVCFALSVSVCIGALCHLLGWNFGEIIEQRDGPFRAFGPLGDQVAFVVVLPALISLVAGRPLLFGLHLSALLLTGTRGAMVCLAVGILVHLLRATRRPSRHGWRLRSTVATALVGAVLWLSPVSATLRDRFSSPTMRTAAFEAGIDVVREHPLLGVGFNGLDANRSAVAEDWTTPLQAANGLSRASNQYIQTAVDGGVGALLLLLLFVGVSIRNALRVMQWREVTPEVLGTQLWLISMFVGNQGSLWLLSNTVSGFFTFAIAGLAASASVLSRSDRT